MKILNTFFLLLLALFLNAQEANNIVLLDNWENPDLPDAGALSYNDVWGYTDCNGNEYGIFGSSAFVHFFNVTDPTNIIHIDSFAGGGTTIWRDMKTFRDHAYAVCDNCPEGLMVFDLGNVPTSVDMVLQTTEYFTSCHNIFVDQEAGRLYAVGTNTNGGGVHVFDLNEDPGNPVLLGEPTLPGGYVHDINVVNNIAYASSGNNGLYVYDFTDPNNVLLLGTLTQYPEQGYNHSSWPTLDQNYLVMADETFDRGVKILDISDLEDITVEDVFRSELLAPEATGSIAHNPFIRGDYVFISYYHDGLQVFDISDPQNVTQVAGYDTEPDNTDYAGFTGMWGTYPFLPSGTILCSDTHRGFFTLGVENLELEETTAPSFPEVSLATPAITQVCEGQTVTLNATEGAMTYEWMQNGSLNEETSSPTFMADETGDYTVTAANQHCRTEAEETISITVTESPDATISSLGDSFLCGNTDTEVLSMPEGAQGYIWFLDGEQIIGQSQSELLIEETGLYTGIAVSNGCTSESNEVTVGGFQEELDLAINPAMSIACIGESVDLNVEDNYDNYQWTLNGNPIPAATTTEYTATESGEYAVSVNFFQDCDLSSNSAEVEFVAAEVPTLTVNMNLLISSNAATWQWLINGEAIDGATEQSYTAEVTGSYSVSITDENGCSATSEATEIVVSGLYQVEAGFVQILPNPISSYLEIRLDTDAQYANYRIFDIAGRTIETYNSNLTNGTIQIDASHWTSGMYLLELTLDGKSVLTERIVKQ